MKFFLFLLSIILSPQSNAQTVVSSKLSSCDINSSIELLQRRIVDRKIVGDTLYMTIGFVTNCCASIHPEVSRSNDTLFLMNPNRTEIVCSCDCCFELEIKLTGVPDTNFVLIFGEREFRSKTKKYALLPEQYNIPKYSKINQLNGEGQKIGLWETNYDKSKKVHYQEYYLIDETGYYLAWTRSFDKKGNLTLVEIKNGANGYIIEFDAMEYEGLKQQLSP